MPRRLHADAQCYPFFTTKKDWSDFQRKKGMDYRGFMEWVDRLQPRWHFSAR